MAIIMVLAAFWAPQIAQFDGLFKYIQEMLAYMVPPVTVLFLLGVFWKAGTANGALATLIGGHAVAIFLFLGGNGLLTGGEPLWDTPIHFTLVAGIVFAASLIIYVATASWGELKTDEQLEELMVQPSEPAQAGWKDYRLQSGVLLALTAGIVIMFW